MGLSGAISFFLTAKTAYRIHSPFVFDFCEQVLDNHNTYYAYEDLDALKQLHHEKDTNLITPYLSRLLFRISQWYQAEVMHCVENCKIQIIAALHKGNTDALLHLLDVMSSNVMIDSIGSINGFQKIGSSVTNASSLTASRWLICFADGDILQLEELFFPNKENNKSIIWIFPRIHQSPNHVKRWQKICALYPDYLRLELWQVGLIITDPLLVRGEKLCLIPKRWKFYQI